MAIRKSTKHQSAITDNDLSDIGRLWILRMLEPLGGHAKFIERGGYENVKLAQALNLAYAEDVCAINFGDEEQEFSDKVARIALRKAYMAAEKKYMRADLPPLLRKNLSDLAQLLHFSAVECKILAFAVMLHGEALLDATSDMLGKLTPPKVIRSLSVILSLSESDVREALDKSSFLSRSGLLNFDRSNQYSMMGSLEIFPEDLTHLLMTSNLDPIQLLKGKVNISTPAELAMSDYEHIAESLAVLRPYLKRSLDAQKPGVNIFIHGAPGTGKSQLAKVLAREFVCDLFEVASEDEEGDAITGGLRLRAFKVAQTFFAKRCTLMLFDEAEDVFNDGNNLFGKKSTAQVHKAWMNRMLEENPVPTIWLSNSVSCLDRAFIRRFDMVIEMPIPPRKQRARIISDACADLLTPKQVDQIADSAQLSPAAVTRASAVVRTIRDDLGEIAPAQVMQLLINQTLEAQGHKTIRANDPDRVPDIYDPAFIHADADLAHIAQGLQQSKSGRLCLYGPPGTGKTAYGRWLAAHLEVPLIIKRGSDLFGPYVGQSEQNIAEAFKEAEVERGVLLIDEVDSFLQDRRNAQHGWESAIVNEMLTQMESFSGIFIASTNLMKELDPAALRRFDLKVKFDFLQPSQAAELLRRHCVQLNIDAPSESDLRSIARLTNLTPGDFAAVIRQHRFRPISSATAVVKALADECSIKQAPVKAMGFC
jgi:transitional endoplasmic reticulum ATPase